MPSLEIVIVNYNAGNWLLRSVNSALANSDASVAVVDNASTDSSVSDTKLALPNEVRLRWIENSDNRGFAAANNQVLAELSTDYAVLMNPDCEINAETLPNIIKACEADPQIGLASCRIYNQDGSIQTSCRRRFPTPWSAFVRLFHLNTLFPNHPKFRDFDYGSPDADMQNSEIEYIEAISGAFMVVRRSALEQVGLLDEGYFMHCEDLDWCKRFELSGWKVAFVSQASLVHAKGISTDSRPIGVLLTLHLGMVRFFDKFYKQDTSMPLMLLVKLGIAVSFLMRSALAIGGKLFSFLRATPSNQSSSGTDS